MPTRTLYASETFLSAIMMHNVQDIMDLLGREQIDLAKLKRTYKLKVNLQTNEQDKYRRTAQALWARGYMWRTR